MNITLRDVANKREPDFNSFLKVLAREKPDRPTLFEFFQNYTVYEEVAGDDIPSGEESFPYIIQTFYTLGYDYTNIHASNFGFPKKKAARRGESQSMNENPDIVDLESYKAYRWKSPSNMYDGRIERLTPYLPKGMKFTIFGPGGVLENVISLTGYDNLCLMLYDDPGLAEQIFYEVGTRLIEYYELIIDKDPVGAVISNDDWGFNTQTMLSPADMRRYVFPWHKKIVEVAHKAGKKIILHSCGQLREVSDDIIDDMGYDARHSFEDNIEPIERAYERIGGRIALLGGIDLDFMCRESHENIIKRARALIEQTECKGYALGTGNSIPPYLPSNNYYAMISAALM